MDLEEAQPTVKKVPASATLASPTDTGRRRPGRPKQVSPHLIPLLRSSTPSGIGGLTVGETDTSILEDDLAPAKGVLVGLALSVPLWAGIGALAWAVLR